MPGLKRCGGKREEGVAVKEPLRNPPTGGNVRYLGCITTPAVMYCSSAIYYFGEKWVKSARGISLCYFLQLHANL